jgi:hypothetical protein
MTNYDHVEDFAAENVSDPISDRAKGIRPDLQNA